ncbi:WSC domain-containing protein [Verticillium alfalfae VaMs.102]|uniref:WSC domain-containing protein n=1 Tax=Verticillium alfalfae (strain VaMs.102 / ATCC MYA-4576 / FGSC 10136) TaxID=526221 RepID=C9SEU2_VERA1|nr:WSC domain-containing protein [Verticillium alfalfae VaMs.102]EEY16685.1 WSC domain-containing protein [Verticillium alfalfae VaMs.102]
MKYSAAALAAVFGTAAASHPGAFAVLRFNGKEIVQGRIDPIVSPKAVAQHVHGAVGGNNFAMDSTGESLAKSECTSAKALDDKSAYWFPWLYFHDEAKDTFEPVDINYVNVYYFFDKTDDDIKAFPQGLQIVGGDPGTRVAPQTNGKLNLDPSRGPIQSAMWTCPQDCPEGWIHVPHMFYEIYWDTPKFADRWTGGQGSQPFVLSNGDVTGFSSHADFLAAWDEDVLQNVIDNCNAGHAGLHSCPGVKVNDNNGCKGVTTVDEIVTGVLSVLPGDRPLEGWTYGTKNGDGTGYNAPKPDSGAKPTTAAATSPKTEPTPEAAATDLPYQHVPEAEVKEEVAPTPVFSSVPEVGAEKPVETPEPTPAPVPEAPVEDVKPVSSSSCSKTTRTVWETVTVVATATEVINNEPTPQPVYGEQKRRHVHNHVYRHRSLRH